MEGFSVIYRNFGHWDITQGSNGRLFRIRGAPGKYAVSDERKGQNAAWVYFSTLPVAMAYICDKLMFELIIAEGQTPTVIEGWNIHN